MTLGWFSLNKSSNLGCLHAVYLLFSFFILSVFRFFSLHILPPHIYVPQANCALKDVTCHAMSAKLLKRYRGDYYYFFTNRHKDCNAWLIKSNTESILTLEPQTVCGSSPLRETLFTFSLDNRLASHLSQNKIPRPISWFVNNPTKTKNKYVFSF